jgi:hypothetical protein
MATENPERFYQRSSTRNASVAVSAFISLLSAAPIRAIHHPPSVVRAEINHSNGWENEVREIKVTRTSDQQQKATPLPPSDWSFEDLNASTPLHILTYELEDLGQDRQMTDSLLEFMKIMLNHEDPTIREGAVLGLAHHVDNATVKTVLETVATNDCDPTIRSIAKRKLQV